MLSFQRVAVWLSLSPSDVDVLRYAAVVARLGITQEFRFIRAASHGSRLGAIHDTQESLAYLEAAVAAHFRAAEDDVDVSCHIIDGNSTGGLLDFVAEHRSELILLAN